MWKGKALLLQLLKKNMGKMSENNINKKINIGTRNKQKTQGSARGVAS